MTNLATSYKPASAISNNFIVADGILVSIFLSDPPIAGGFYGKYNGSAPEFGEVIPFFIANSAKTEGRQILIMGSEGPISGFPDGLTLITVSTIFQTTTKDFFQEFTLNGITLFSSDAAFSTNGLSATWVWAGMVINSIGTYIWSSE